MKRGTAASVALSSATVSTIIVSSSIQNLRVRMTPETVCAGSAWCRSGRCSHERSSDAQCSGTVTIASTPASTRNVPRQSSTPSSSATRGANTVDASPLASVSTVSGVCLRSP